MNFVEPLDNIYVIDAKMFGFDNYCAAYLVKGKGPVLIDTGLPNQTEALRGGIKAHGVSISDISHIFITHTHIDHIGNVAKILKENPQTTVYIHPLGLKPLTHPLEYPKEFAARWGGLGTCEPVSPSRIKLLNDGDVFDIGNGEKLRIIFAPGHLPDGIVIFEEKNKGLFINDLPGNWFADAGVQYPLPNFGADPIQQIGSLKKLMDFPVSNLYLGHYGVCNRPKDLMTRAINDIRKLLNIGIKCMSEGKPESIAGEVYKVILPELEKLRLARGEAVYEYATQEHIPVLCKAFAKYCQKRF